MTIIRALQRAWTFLFRDWLPVTFVAILCALCMSVVVGVKADAAQEKKAKLTERDLLELQVVYTRQIADEVRRIRQRMED